MGYCARDGSGDGKAHYFPRVNLGPVIDHVADSNARLSLTAEGVVVSGGTGIDGVYTQRGLGGDGGARPYYNKSDKPSSTIDNAIVFVSGAWTLTGGSGPYTTGDTAEFPWDCVWTDPGHGNPTPIVTHSPGQVTGAGYQVTQDDEGNAIVHTFNGDGADADAGLWVTGGGAPVGPYGVSGTGDGVNTYEGYPPDIAGQTLARNTGHVPVVWSFNDNIPTSLDAPDYPWQADWSLSATVVTRNPIASPANWSHP